MHLSPEAKHHQAVRGSFASIPGLLVAADFSVEVTTKAFKGAPALVGVLGLSPSCGQKRNRS